MSAHAAFDLLTFVPSRNNHSLPKTNPVAMNNNPNDISILFTTSSISIKTTDTIKSEAK